MKKRIICIVLVLCLLAPMGAYARDGYLEDMDFKEQIACSLKALGVFSGVSDYDFALERAPSRAEAVVMLLRLLGLSETASRSSYDHPFTDLGGIAWAEPYIAYAYEHKLAAGVSGTTFGGRQGAGAEMYLTFVLRALGYSDSAGGDFTWNDPYELAEKAGILPKGVNTGNFLRGDLALISYAALNAKLKGSDLTLADTLIARGFFSRDDFDTYYDAGALEQGKIERSKYLEIQEFMLRLDISGGIDTSGMVIKSYGSVSRFGDSAYEMYGFYKNGAEKNAAQVKNASEVLDGKARVFYLIVPNGLGIMLSDSDFAKYCKSSKTEAEGIAYAYEAAGDKVAGVDVLTTLRAHNSEYVTFRTDHHWTGLGAYYGYREWAKQAGFEPVDIADYEQLVMPGHFGMFYGRCGNPREMKDNPDTVIGFRPKGDYTVKVTNLQGKTYDSQLIIDYSNSSYKYGTYLGGDNPIVEITNNDFEGDSACVLVKDSNGNALPGYLCQHYKTVYVIDYRYYYKLPGYLTFSRFNEEKGVTDFIVSASLTLSQSDTTANYLAKYCK